MNIINQAIIFAAKAHEGQFRKATNIPYITHPYAVGMLLQEAKCPDEVIAAGILHDTLEDTETSFEELVEQFGLRVAKLVLAASEEDKTLSWEERKQRTIDALPHAYTEEIHIIVADKLHNLRSIRADLEVHGEETWARFNKGKRDQYWYYSHIVKALLPRKKECKLIGELEKEVKAVFDTDKKMTNQEISFLFSSAYGQYNPEYAGNVSPDLIELAKELCEEGQRILREEYDEVTIKLDDLSSRGINFASNSDGPFLLASYSIGLQRRFRWTDRQLHKHFKQNLNEF